MKIFKFITLGFIYLSMMFAFTSCDEKESELDNGKEIENEIENATTGTMPSLAQKQKIEQTGINFLNQIKATDFEQTFNLVNYISWKYSDYKTDEIEDWYEACFTAMVKHMGTDSFDASTAWHKYIHNIHYLKSLILASAFTGKFEAKNNKWNYTSASDLEFLVKDSAGNDCSLKLTTSGKTKNIYIGYTNDWDSDYVDGLYIENEYYNSLYIALPEVLKITLTQNKTVLSELTINADLSSIKEEDFNIYTDKIALNTNLKLNNYDFGADEITYDSKSNVSFNIYAKKDNNTLISIKANANGQINEEYATVKEVTFAADIMGEVQIKGVCTDMMKMIDYLERADDEDENEAKFKSYINQANSLLNLGIYYDGKNEKHASMILESFSDKQYYGETWFYEPVIKFNDGTDYTTFDVFFDDRDYTGFINKLNSLIEDFMNL